LLLLSTAVLEDKLPSLRVRFGNPGVRTVGSTCLVARGCACSDIGGELPAFAGKPGNFELLLRRYLVPPDARGAMRWGFSS